MTGPGPVSSWYLVHLRTPVCRIAVGGRHGYHVAYQRYRSNGSSRFWSASLSIRRLHCLTACLQLSVALARFDNSTGMRHSPCPYQVPSSVRRIGTGRASETSRTSSDRGSFVGGEQRGSACMTSAVAGSRDCAVSTGFHEKMAVRPLSGRGQHEYRVLFQRGSVDHRPDDFSTRLNKPRIPAGTATRRTAETARTSCHRTLSGRYPMSAPPGEQ